MAPVGLKIGSGEQDDKEGYQNLWYSILGEVSTHSSSKLPTDKSILVLGDDESGKTSMIARLEGNEDPKRGSGLEYTYLDVRDEDRDDIARCGVWLLDGDADHTRLLKFALTADNIEDTLVLLVVDMSQPWNVKASLQKWSTELSQHIRSLQISPQKMRDLEQRLVQQFQTYLEPDSSQEGQTRTTAVTPSDEEQVLLPLGETTLTHNVGVPIIVVCTKSDAVSSLEKDHDYRIEHLDYIQQFIRKFCLNFGAALFYISVKEEKNCDLLKKYLLHRIYGFPFSTPPLVVEKEALFIPTGWDSLKKISICYENMSNIKPEDPFEDVLIRPPVRKTVQDCREVVAEDEQLFLLRQQNMLSKNISQGKVAESPQRPSKASPVPSAVTPGTAGKAKIDPSKAGGTPNEGVLANFFNSLLSKKTGAGSPQSKAGDKAVRSDAKAELDRMTRGKPVPSQGSTTAGSGS